MKLIVYKIFFDFHAFIKNWIWQTQSYFDKNFLYLSKKHPKTNLKSFQCQILTSVKRSEKQ